MNITRHDIARVDFSQTVARDEIQHFIRNDVYGLDVDAALLNILTKFEYMIVSECADICHRSDSDEGVLLAHELLYEFNIDGARNRK